MYPTSLRLLDWNTLIMHGKEYNLSSVSMYSFLESFVSSFPLGSIIVLRHSHPTSFKSIVMLSPIYTNVFHVGYFLQVSQNPKCISLLPLVAANLNVILFTSVRNSQNSQLLNRTICIVLAQNQTINVKSMDRKKIQPLKSSMALIASSI